MAKQNVIGAACSSKPVEYHTGVWGWDYMLTLFFILKKAGNIILNMPKAKLKVFSSVWEYWWEDSSGDETDESLMSHRLTGEVTCGDNASPLCKSDVMYPKCSQSISQMSETEILSLMTVTLPAPTSIHAPQSLLGCLSDFLETLMEWACKNESLGILFLILFFQGLNAQFDWSSCIS